MPADSPRTDETFLESAIATFRSQKKLADRAIAQLSDPQLRRAIDENTNSVAVVMKHMAGNMLSRWTDLLTTDGEKPWRHRDHEFVDDIDSRDELAALWERGWDRLFATLKALTPDDLTKTVRIRGEPHSVIRAIHRQLDHYGYHVGQIVLTARLLAKDNWTTLSIPRGASEAFNRQMWRKD